VHRIRPIPNRNAFREKEIEKKGAKEGKSSVASGNDGDSMEFRGILVQVGLGDPVALKYVPKVL
jgi:hypothetical protein